MSGPPVTIRAVLVIGLVLATLTAPGPACAQPYGDAGEGRQIAATWCGDCHQVGPMANPVATDAIPSFQAVAEMTSTTVLSLRAFLRTPHDVMPDFKLTEAQIDDVSAYILGLRPRR